MAMQSTHEQTEKSACRRLRAQQRRSGTHAGQRRTEAVRFRDDAQRKTQSRNDERSARQHPNRSRDDPRPATKHRRSRAIVRRSFLADE
jgi:hypothetical protein